MDPVWIFVAFVLGFAVRQIGLPPLVGFLGAGFLLNAMGEVGGEALEHIADLGIYLLLFSIGLKLRLRSLLRPEIWAGTSVHMLVTVAVFGLGIFLLSWAGVSIFADLGFWQAMLVAFALSFSSTVFAVKVLEEKGEMGSLHGRVSIGILIMQDVIAIVFLTVSTGKVPSIWALGLLGLPLLRRPLFWLMGRAGHGELLVLMGVLLTLGSAGLFSLVGMKPDLGVLVAGVLVGGHVKSKEISESLMGFKDLFLVGFFLQIGMSGRPGLEDIVIALLLVVLVPLKVWLFFWLLTRFKLRSRTSLLGSLSLANYSEFGLIVGAVGVSKGWIDSQWLVIIAIALSISYVAASPVNSAAHRIYARFDRRLKGFEVAGHHPDDVPIDLGQASVLVFGMGRVGRGAYDQLRREFGDGVLGVDHDSARVAKHCQAGLKVILGDASDSDFWQRVKPGEVKLVMLAMADHKATMYAARQLKDSGYSGLIAATAGFDDQKVQLKEAGVAAVFNYHEGAGAGFADHVFEVMGQDNKQ